MYMNKALTGQTGHCFPFEQEQTFNSWQMNERQDFC